jgi:hypothetical protein
LGIKEMKWAFAGDFSGLVFLTARYGFFQPAAEITEYVLVVHMGVRYHVGNGLRHLRLFFQKLGTLSIVCFSRLWNGQQKRQRKNQH